MISFLALHFLTTAAQPLAATPPAEHAAAFRPFTGKVASNKVRLRVKPDLESHIVRQVNKQDLLLIIGEEGEFYAVQPPKGSRAYVFRSYILDNVAEADRINIRLEPHVDAPIIGQLRAGESVAGTPCAINSKWLEIDPPANTRFYISKDFIVQAGGPELLSQMEHRKSQVDTLLSAALCLAEAECKKPFEEMSIEGAMDQLQLIVRDFSDFPASLSHAKEALTLLKETYLQKKVAYLENPSHPTIVQNANVFKMSPIESFSQESNYWGAVEESLYMSWSAFHTGKQKEDFYQEQRANASIIEGTLEPYRQSVKNKPGDYILRSKDRPIAYLYSTSFNLDQHIGKQVSLLVSPRPNNHFAFPAYFVLSLE